MIPFLPSDIELGKHRRNSHEIFQLEIWLAKICNVEYIALRWLSILFISSDNNEDSFHHSRWMLHTIGFYRIENNLFMAFENFIVWITREAILLFASRNKVQSSLTLDNWTTMGQASQYMRNIHWSFISQHQRRIVCFFSAFIAEDNNAWDPP